MKEDDVGFSRKKTKMLFQIASAAQRSSWRCFSFEEIFIATNAFSSCCLLSFLGACFSLKRPRVLGLTRWAFGGS
ncbi:hypothetical protein V6N12_021092 [Hibiscus sabdariffa]|uniref:Uncharacterized protein n=1 Tax=Hibiscus sabdariffa TaxID=183260 RepID=A0ABR2B3N7_9ROSI